MSTSHDPCPQARRHREMLVTAVLVLVLSFVLQVGSDDRVIIKGLPEYPLPPTCMSRELFGVKCPGCGLTRSFVHIANGEWAASWQCHRLGWLMVAAVLLQFPYRIFGLRRGGLPPLGTRAPQWFGYLLIACLLANWFLEMLIPVL